MVFKIDFYGSGARLWSRTSDGVTTELDADYTPTMYVGVGEPPAPSPDAKLTKAQDALTGLGTVDDVTVTTRRRGWRTGPESVLRVDARGLPDLRSLASMVQQWETPGDYRCYNVDFSPQFRYCLETNVSPVPNAELTTLDIRISRAELADPPIAQARIAGEQHDASPQRILEKLDDKLTATDPDLLIVSSADVIPVLMEQIESGPIDMHLGRRPGWSQLASRSTYTSYGRVGHSAARYDIPGRAIINLDNTFFYDETNLEGCLDLVERSWKPIQELGWASIGNVLTAIQIRYAHERDVLAQWQAWRPERFKSMSQLHAADRGGHTFAPNVGIHENVYELDFSSLYPNIIITRNISPETVRCECHPERESVPELGYSICPEPGYLPEVLRPLVDDRDAIKTAIKATDDPDERRALEGKSSALKWILVSCFGYQGFSNAKYGRIECHEAINAFARDILLTAKEYLERGGWRLVHGIVDSLWVTPDANRRQRPLATIAEEVSDEVGIRLEYEAGYDWLALVPLRDSDAGALTKYFGAVQGSNEYKYRGIECRQRSTCEFVKEVQQELIKVYDAMREPRRVCHWLQAHLSRLTREDIPPEKLAIQSRVSKHLDEYEHYTRSVAALERTQATVHDVHPGQDVHYVVVNDDAENADRVRLPAEASTYDVSFYQDRLIRAAESILAPMGWDESRIRDFLSEHRATTLSRF